MVSRVFKEICTCLDGSSEPCRVCDDPLFVPNTGDAMSERRQCEHDFTWRLQGCNERGWECINCKHKPGEDPGYSPQLDLELIHKKVEAILFDLHHLEVLYVSNGDHGDAIVRSVSRKLRESRRLDQQTIVRELVNSDGWSFWRERGESIREGRDNRDRCGCGKLASTYSGAERWCSECDRGRPPF